MTSSPTTNPFTGLGVALATPFTTGTDAVGGTRKPQVDHAAYARLVEHVLADGRGVQWLVVLGSTGEAATVTDVERVALIRQAVSLAGDVPVVVGVGANDTERAVELATEAVAAGADGLLVVTPFYNKPQVSGLVAHFRAVAEAAPGTPIIAYNVPGRTGCNITPAAMRQIWTVPEVVALKESSGDIRQITQLCREAPAGCDVLCGDDDLLVPAAAVGARGLVSVCANVAPVETRRLVDAALAGDVVGARAAGDLLAELMTAMFVETNPVPVKAALACLGLSTAMVRLPLSPAEPGTWTAVQRALAGLLAARRSVSVPADGLGALPRPLGPVTPLVPSSPAALAS